LRGLPGLTLDDDAEAFRSEVRRFLAEVLTGGARDSRDLTGWDQTFEREVVRAAGEAGLLGVSLPVDLGGRGKPPSWQAALSYEAAYHDAPLIDTAAVLVAPTVATFGSAAQRDAVVRAACAGTINACIAYTEAGAGSDLSNIETTATARDDGGYVLDGEKVFVTGAHKADWCCTIARTDPSSHGKRGLSMFLVDMTGAGIEVERHPTANQWTLGTIRFSGAPVAADARLGQEGEGWRQMSGALLAERSGVAWLGWATRVLEALLDHCAGTRDVALRDALAGLVTRWFAAVARVERVIALQDEGAAPIAEGAASKVCVTELLQRIGRVGATALGAEALTAPGWFGGSVPEWLAYEVVERLHPTLSVGANEIQRTTIADVGLGLPPERGLVDTKRAREDLRASS
jgi:alkylation response protein AidB-like acyl-CoA dehydrogenase